MCRLKATLLLVGLLLVPWYASAAPWGADGRGWGLVAALTALAVASCAARPGQRIPLGFWGLVLLALPVLPAMHAYLGYPLRLLTASLAAPLLQLGGFGVTREATVLHWQGSSFDVAEACSGVRKLWAALYFACALSSFARLTPWQTLGVLAVAGLGALAGNAIRVAGLFHIVTVWGFLSSSPWGEWTGIVSFTLPAGLTLLAVWHQRRRQGGRALSPDPSVT